jgi:transcriptional regulator with XRE-family HTH domain
MAKIMTEHQWRRLFSNKLYNFMAISGMNQIELAEYIGVNRSILGRWIRMECTPSTYSFIKVASKLDWDLSEFKIGKD